MIEGCAFCIEIEERLSFDAVLNGLGAPRLARIVGENSEFVVLPSLGPLTDDHLLIVTKEHISSFRSADAGLRSSLLSAAALLAEQLAIRSGQRALVFENGSQSYRPGCVDHLHIHLLTLPAVVADRVLKRFAADKLMSPGALVSAPIRIDGDYVILQIGTSGEWAIMARPVIDRQLVRRLVAEELDNIAAWNWRDAPNLDAVRVMARELGAVVERAGFQRAAT